MQSVPWIKERQGTRDTFRVFLGLSGQRYLNECGLPEEVLQDVGPLGRNGIILFSVLT